jgi:hypothetical protein
MRKNAPESVEHLQVVVGNALFPSDQPDARVGHGQVLGVRVLVAALQMQIGTKSELVSDFCYLNFIYNLVIHGKITKI